MSDPAAFYRCTALRSDELATQPELLAAIWRGDANAVVVSDFVGRDEAARAIERASADSPPHRRFAREFEAYSIGPCLDQAERGLDAYLDEAQRFAPTLRRLFDAPDFETRLLAALGAMSGGRAVERARADDGREYALATLRRLPPGGLIPPHFENEQLARAPYRHLSRLLDATTLMSFYLTLAPAQSGGEVSVHDFRWADVHRVAWRDSHVDVAGLLHGRAQRLISPRAGELLIFDGGRFVHQVLAVGGTADRWTLGGFIGFARDGRTIFVWA